MQHRTGGQIVADHLQANGIDAAFCVPGESFLAVLDALYDGPTRLITCRHEASAANAAVAYGKLTGRPGVCLVTRGPGATQAAAGVHTAAQDSAPLLLLVGQVGRAVRGREAFQELDVPAVFGPMAKWAAEATDPARLPELLARAVRVATPARAGGPGPARGRAVRRRPGRGRPSGPAGRPRGRPGRPGPPA
jgi:acetolactate synthase-1/2/3 large subunit